MFTEASINQNTIRQEISADQKFDINPFWLRQSIVQTIANIKWLVINMYVDAFLHLHVNEFHVKAEFVRTGSFENFLSCEIYPTTVEWWCKLINYIYHVPSRKTTYTTFMST